MLKQRYLTVWLVLLCSTVAIHAAAQIETAAELSFRGQVAAGGIVYAEIEYQLPEPLLAGGSIVVRQHWSETQRLQIESPESLNYVRIVSGATLEAELVAHYVEVDDEAGELATQATAIAFEVASGELPAGTDLRFIVENLQLPTTAMDSYGLPLFLKSDPDASPVNVPTNTVRIAARDFSQLRLSASSTARPGEPIELQLRLEDEYGNLSLGRNLSLDLLVNGVFRQRVNVADPVQRINGVSLEAPGSYELEIRTGGGGIAATSNPVLVRDHRRKILWADIGAPTNMSEGTRSFEEMERAAMGRYDLFLPADHEEHRKHAPIPTVDNTYVESRWGSQASGGASLVLTDNQGDSFTIATPEQPTDLRWMDPDTLRLVEIVSGGSVYDWFGVKAADQGFRVGFTGSSHSHQYPSRYPGQFREVNTAVWLMDGQDWFEAMRNHQTYVSVGSKMVLILNRTGLELDPIRNLGLEIVADAPVVSVEVFKNGRLFKTWRQGDIEGNRFRLVIESSSEPFSATASRPRNAREWVGYLATRDTGITVKEVNDYWQVKPGRQVGRVDFLARTHGLAESLEFELASTSLDTVIEVGIAPGYEDTAWLPADRLPKPTPGQKFLIPIAEALQGGARTFDVEGYRDAIRIEPALIPFDSSMRYEFDDPSTPRIGDYYYFRVRLQDGSFAYTSPIYVGDFE